MFRIWKIAFIVFVLGIFKPGYTCLSLKPEYAYQGKHAIVGIGNKRSSVKCIHLESVDSNTFFYHERLFADGINT